MDGGSDFMIYSFHWVLREALINCSFLRIKSKSFNKKQKGYSTLQKTLYETQHNFCFIRSGHYPLNTFLYMT